jgi:hypothetical protein
MAISNGTANPARISPIEISMQRRGIHFMIVRLRRSTTTMRRPLALRTLVSVAISASDTSADYALRVVEIQEYVITRNW